MLLQGISGQDASRTVSLSDLYDDLCSSSSWLHSTSQDNVANTSAVNSRTEPRIELSALLSHSSTSDAEIFEASLNGSRTLPSYCGRPPAAQGNSTATAACDAVTADADAEAEAATNQIGYASDSKGTTQSFASRQQQRWVRLNLTQQPEGQQQGQHSTPTQQAAGSPRSQQRQPQQQAVTTPQQQTKHNTSPRGQASYAEMLQSRRLRSSASTVPESTSPRMAGKLLPVTGTAAAAAATQATTAAVAAEAEPGSNDASHKVLTERKLVKCLKKLQQDKQRLNSQVQQLLESQAKLLLSVQTATGQQRMSAARGPSMRLSAISTSGVPPIFQQPQVQEAKEQQQQQQRQGEHWDEVTVGEGPFADGPLSSTTQVTQLHAHSQQQQQQQGLQEAQGRSTTKALQAQEDWQPHQQQHQQQLEDGGAYNQACLQDTSPDRQSTVCPALSGTCLTAHDSSSAPAAAADDSSSRGTDLPSQPEGCSSPMAASIPASPQAQHTSHGAVPDVLATGGALRPLKSLVRVAGATHGLSLSSSQLQKQVQEQQVVIEEQAATIKDLKTVVSELESQTSHLRARAAKADSNAEALAEAQSALAERDQQLQAAAEEIERLRDLAQTAVREALRTCREAEAQRDNLQQMLQEQQEARAAAEAAAEAERASAQQVQQEAAQQAEAQLEAVRQERASLAETVERLKGERRHLLQHLQEANSQIMDLHDELGPAILRGSTSPSRASRLSALRASVAGAAGGGGGGGSRSEPGVGQHSSEPGAAAAAGDLGRREGPAVSGVNSELVSALQHLTGHTVQLKEASREAKAAAEAAAEAAAAAESEKLDVAGQLQDLEEAYKELQQKHGQLSAAHKVLTEEHSSLLNRQVGTASQRTSLRQELLTLEEQYLAAKAQVVELQDELAQLRSKQLADSAQHAAARPTAQGAATAGTAADAGAADAAATKAAQEHQLLQEQLLNLAADNAHLAVALAETVLSQHQQGAGAPPAAAAAAADGSSDDGSGQEQRLQLLLSQLVAVKDQVAAAHELSQQQQGVIKTQQRRLLELLQALATLQQEHAAALAAQHEQRHHHQQQQQQQRGSNTWDPVDKAYAASSRQSVKPQSTSSNSAGARHGLSQRQGDTPAPAAAAAAAAAALEELQEENGRLRLAVAEALAAVRQLSVEREVLLEGLVDGAAVQELDAKNRGLLQELTRLLDESASLRSQLAAARWGPDNPTPQALAGRTASATGQEGPAAAAAAAAATAGAGVGGLSSRANSSSLSLQLAMPDQLQQQQLRRSSAPSLTVGVPEPGVWSPRLAEGPAAAAAAGAVDSSSQAAPDFTRVLDPRSSSSIRDRSRSPVREPSLARTTDASGGTSASFGSTVVAPNKHGSLLANTASNPEAAGRASFSQMHAGEATGLTHSAGSSHSARVSWAAQLNDFGMPQPTGEASASGGVRSPSSPGAKGRAPWASLEGVHTQQSGHAAAAATAAAVLAADVAAVGAPTSGSSSPTGRWSRQHSWTPPAVLSVQSSAHDAAAAAPGMSGSALSAERSAGSQTHPALAAAAAGQPGGLSDAQALIAAALQRSRSRGHGPPAIDAAVSQGQQQQQTGPQAPQSPRDGALASPRSASIVASVLERQRSRAVSLSLSTQNSMTDRPQQQLQQEQQPEQRQQQNAGGELSRTGSASFNRLDRASLISAVLQRQMSKRSSLAAAAASTTDALSGGSSSMSLTGAGAQRSPSLPASVAAASFGLASAAAAANSAVASAAGSTMPSRAGSLAVSGTMDRAAVVAAVMAKRGASAASEGLYAQVPAQQQQQQGRSSVASPAPPGSDIGSRGVSPVCGEVSKDRASIVAAVLAKHNLAAKH